MTKTLTLMATTLLALTSAVALAGPKQQPRQPTDEVVISSKVMVVRGMRGGEPQITDKRGKRWLVVGPLQGELVRLHGHKVKVWGTPGAKKLMTPTVKARQYEILDSGGAKPVVGRLVLDGRRLMLERKGDTLVVTARRSTARRLRKRVGCRVWMVGSLQTKKIKVSMYGWLSCQPPKTMKPKKENAK